MNPKKAEYMISAVSAAQYPQLKLPTFVFLGRSNVGKSSFINAITSRKNLAYTSSKPGKTIALNFYNIDDELLFVDVPGYGYAKHQIDRRIQFGGMIEQFLKVNENLKFCFLIVDLRHKPTNDDCLMYKYLKSLERKIIVIATKADKLSKNEINNNLRLIKTTLELEGDDLCFPVSSETKYGLEKIDELFLEYRNIK